MEKKAGIIILLIGLLCIITYAGFWVEYYFAMQEANKEAIEMACKENMERQFEGRLANIERFEYNNDMHNRFFSLHIIISDSTNISIDYQYNLEPNKEILDFAKTGQLAVKVKGEDSFTLMDTTGEKKTFKIAKCAKYE